MEKGKVKWFNDIKGFGFILRESGEDVFVHYSVIEGSGYRSIYEGQTVEFECVRGPKGLLASKVVKTENGRPDMRAGSSPRNITM